MSKSIMQEEKACYITGRTDHLHKHHIFGGGRRKISEKWGLWIWLTGEYHNLSAHGIHFDGKLDRLVKAQCQQRFEEIHGQTAMEESGLNVLRLERKNDE